MAGQFPFEIEVPCQCGDPDCDRTMTLTPKEYVALKDQFQDPHGYIQHADCTFDDVVVLLDLGEYQVRALKEAQNELLEEGTDEFAGGT